MKSWHDAKEGSPYSAPQWLNSIISQSVASVAFLPLKCGAFLHRHNYDVNLTYKRGCTFELGGHFSLVSCSVHITGGL